MKRATLFTLVLIAPLLAACAGGGGGGTLASPLFNRHQCGDLDWNRAGVADGRVGFDDVEARYKALAENCIKHGVDPDREGYFQGYEEGRRLAGS